MLTTCGILWLRVIVRDELLFGVGGGRVVGMNDFQFQFDNQDYKNVSAENFRKMLEKNGKENFQRIFSTHMTEEQKEIYLDFMSENIPASSLAPIDFNMAMGEYRNILMSIDGESMLFVLDAIEFYSKHFQDKVPARTAREMKYNQEALHDDFVSAWRKGVAPSDELNVYGLLDS